MNPQQAPSSTNDQTAPRDVSATAASRVQDPKASAKAAVDDLKSEAHERASAAKDSVAEEVSSVASALRTAAQEMRAGSPQERTMGQIADGLADASEAIRDKDLGEIVQGVSSFARRNPAVFLGASALLGFAATRFAKASGTHQASSSASASSHASTSTTTPSHVSEGYSGERT